MRYRQEALEAFYEGFKTAGIDFAVYLPDSMLDGIEQLIIERGDIEMYQCSREDEGIAMAMGAFLVGKRPVALMEGSGIGMSALILARGIVQKTPTLLIAGHNSTLGERYDYHGATRLGGGAGSTRPRVFRTMFFSIPLIFAKSLSKRKQPSKGSAFRWASWCQAMSSAKSERADEPHRSPSTHRRPAQRRSHDHQSGTGELPDRGWRKMNR